MPNLAKVSPAFVWLYSNCRDAMFHLLFWAFLAASLCAIFWYCDWDLLSCFIAVFHMTTKTISVILSRSGKDMMDLSKIKFLDRDCPELLWNCRYQTMSSWVQKYFGVLLNKNSVIQEKRETERNMEIMQVTLISKPEGVGYLELTMNHQSFAQFAENCFTLSFLVGLTCT